jgi:endonuclease G
MSPQVPSYNRGIWKKGEDLVRTWAREYEELYIVVGPVLKSGLPTIGPNKVSVPAFYYKVILDYKGPDTKAIAFIMANEGSAESLQSFAVSVDSVEKLTGIDFFPSLPDEEENRLEKEVCIPCWIWNQTSPRRHGTSSRGGSAPVSGRRQGVASERTNRNAEVSTQCNAITKKGTRCSRRAKANSSYCWQHGG